MYSKMYFAKYTAYIYIYVIRKKCNPTEKSKKLKNRLVSEKLNACSFPPIETRYKGFLNCKLYDEKFHT